MTFMLSNPKVVAALQPWAKISERLRRNFKRWSKQIDLDLRQVKN